MPDSLYKRNYYVSFMEDSAAWHGKAPNDEQFEEAHAELKGYK